MKPIALAAALCAAVTLTACSETASSGTPSGGAAVTPPASAELAASLIPSAWTATEIAGKPVLPGSSVTLAFGADGRVSGTATCNRFAGPVSLRGDTVTFGALVSTRMACVGAGLNEQETAFLAALQAAERATVTGDRLEIFSAGAAQPSRFTRSAL